MSTAYHPQTNGQSERMVRTVKEMLRHYIAHNQRDWTDHLPIIEFAYNNAIHPSTGMTPFELDLGQHPILPDTIIAEEKEVPATDEFIEQQDARLSMAQDALQQAQMQQAKYYNQGRRNDSFSVGDLVLVSTNHINPPFLRSKGSKKLRPKYVGPWPITRRVGKTTYELDLPAHIKIHPVINTQYLKRFIESPEQFTGRISTPPPPIPIVENEVTEYEVETIKDHRTDNKGKISYLVAWKGYEDHDDTWEPAANLENSQALVMGYWNSQGKQAPPTAKVSPAKRLR
jgi:hypothetical protein